MTTFALLALVNFALGAAAMCVVQSWRQRQLAVAAQREQPTPLVDEPVASDTVPAQSPPPQVNWLTTLMQKVDGDLNRHSFEVDEITEALGDTSPDDAASILAAAASMLVANRRLQADLTAAHQEIEQQREKVDALAAESRTDTLTGLANRRSFDEELGRRLDQWRRHHVPVSLLLVDIDRFKQVNDCYGHPVGDLVLKWIGGIHSRARRQMDLACRYGGEEFAVILPGTKLADAANVAERLRATIAAKKFKQGEQEFPITASVGVTISLPGDDQGALIKRADEALYAAKENGRNAAYLHDGRQVLAIEVDQGLVRHPYETQQLVAVYHGGTDVPDPNEFFPVRSSDISAKGMSFICEKRPDCKAFVVRLGNGDQTRYMVANVANIAPLSKEEPIHYRVGCAFVARLEPDETDVNRSRAASRPELVRC
ncbi:MAG TPA: GGDEF domain-containing protein [Pirellulales bacterium]|jgi:diguanylate cyclase|nr:GGDEF domain-containing protein [Pirellulales bacterium]